MTLPLPPPQSHPVKEVAEVASALEQFNISSCYAVRYLTEAVDISLAVSTYSYMYSYQLFMDILDPGLLVCEFTCELPLSSGTNPGCVAFSAHTSALSMVGMVFE